MYIYTYICVCMSINVLLNLCGVPGEAVPGH